MSFEPTDSAAAKAGNPSNPQRLPTALQADLAAAFPQLERGETRDGTTWLLVAMPQLIGLATWVKARGFVRFLDCTVVDEPSRADRFELNYLLYSMAEHCWLRLKTRSLGEAPSMTSLFAAADWYEREVFDLFGVCFVGHPNLRRILLPDDFEGPAPLRRDVPIGSEPVDFTVTRELYGT
jgi:NADH:ubiquinone oxidoreductase subunit C